jgi:peptidyl-prolyl cis-trans isomerase SDCCAG10
VLLKTTFGDIDIELWSRECPKACRNFVQLALEGVRANCTDAAPLRPVSLLLGACC